MMAQRRVTDRAHRYRANALASGPRVCALCGSRKNITVDHKNGKPDDTRASNVQYLCKSCNTAKGFWFKKAKIGRLTNQYNPAQGVPTFQQYAWAVANHSRGAHDEGGAVIHATPVRLRKEYAGMIADTKRSRGRIADDERWNLANPWPFSDKRLSARQTTPATGGAAYHSARRKPDELNREFLKRSKSKATGKQKPEWIQRMELRDASNPASVDGGEGFETKREAEAFADTLRNKDTWVKISPATLRDRLAPQYHWVVTWGTKRRNPAAASAEVFEEFHGYPSEELVTVRRDRHQHEHLASAGELRKLEVWGVDGKGHKITGFKGALLCFNEAKNQLFVEGGDQSINLKDFGITRPHELETLGQLVSIDYFTRKDHLGDEGGEAVYEHRLRTTNENGKHVVVDVARYPDLIYRVLDQQFEFSGGSYVIRAEGIDK